MTVSPLIGRLLAANPGPFTFKGTGVAIVGQHQVAVIDPGPDDPAHLRSLRDTLHGKHVTHIRDYAYTAIIRLLRTREAVDRRARLRFWPARE